MALVNPAETRPFLVAPDLNAEPRIRRLQPQLLVALEFRLLLETRVVTPHAQTHSQTACLSFAAPLLFVTVSQPKRWPVKSTKAPISPSPPCKAHRAG